MLLTLRILGIGARFSDTARKQARQPNSFMPTKILIYVNPICLHFYRSGPVIPMYLPKCLSNFVAVLATTTTSGRSINTSSYLKHTPQIPFRSFFSYLEPMPSNICSFLHFPIPQIRGVYLRPPIVYTYMRSFRSLHSTKCFTANVLPRFKFLKCFT